jgi:Ni/Fe-hydrogenase subunit HybB-like protein
MTFTGLNLCITATNEIFLVAVGEIETHTENALRFRFNRAVKSMFFNSVYFSIFHLFTYLLRIIIITLFLSRDTRGNGQDVVFAGRYCS